MSFLFCYRKEVTCVRYFHYLSTHQEENVFYQAPKQVTKEAPKKLLEHALGAVLYMPATRPDIAAMITEHKYEDLSSIVFCLEDAIGDHEVKRAEHNVSRQLELIEQAIQHRKIKPDHLPFMFVRVRSPKQLLQLADTLKPALHLLTGFVFPKFSAENARDYVEALEGISGDMTVPLYGMPILETPDLLMKETRAAALSEMSMILHQHQDLILNVRIGATDLCGLYGIRRKSEQTIYDIRMIADFMSDIINYFGREFVISGPVWEYFQASQKPHLLSAHPPVELNEYVKGLVKETELDIANGIHGKTVIHPTHLKIVNSLYVVTKEDYMDALSIIHHGNGSIGVMKSHFSNKMNEIKPHMKWAEKILLKSEIYGVYHENRSFTDLLNEQQNPSNIGQYGG